MILLLLFNGTAPAKNYEEKAIRIPNGNFLPIRIDAVSGEVVSFFRNGWQNANPSMREYLGYLLKNQEDLITNNMTARPKVDP